MRLGAVAILLAAACRTTPVPIPVDATGCGAVAVEVAELTPAIVTQLRAGRIGWQDEVRAVVSGHGPAGACAWAVVVGQAEAGLSWADRPAEPVPDDARGRAEELARAFAADGGGP